MRLAAACALAALLHPRAAVAAEPTLEQVSVALAALNYTRAIDGAQRLLARGGNGPDELRQLLAALAQALGAVGKSPEATIVFRQLLVLEPGYRLPADASPKIRAPLASAQAERGARPGLTLAHSPPASARVDRQLNLALRVERNPLHLVDTARLVMQLPNVAGPTEVTLRASKGDVVFSVALPALGAQPGLLAYRLELLDKDRNVLVRSATPERPHQLVLDRRPSAAGLALPASPAAARRTRAAQRPWYERWWVWTIAGVVVTGVTVGIVAGAASGRGNDVEFGWSVKALR